MPSSSAQRWKRAGLACVACLAAYVVLPSIGPESLAEPQPGATRAKAIALAGVRGEGAVVKLQPAPMGSFEAAQPRTRAPVPIVPPVPPMPPVPPAPSRERVDSAIR